MGWKTDIFSFVGSLLCTSCYKLSKKRIHIAFDMAYDSCKETILPRKYPYDYCRYRTLELIAEEIYQNNVFGNVAEAGVAQGDFAKLINAYFPDRKLYLYDTFEGFNESDKKKDIEKGYTSEEFFHSTKDFRGNGAEKNMENVRLKMKHQENCVFRKGFFPVSATDDSKEIFSFVSIDLDLYDPIFAALQFFYPRLSNGGYIFLHDFNHKEFNGIKIAVDDFEKINGKVTKFPLADSGGTLVISKK